MNEAEPASRPTARVWIRRIALALAVVAAVALGAFVIWGLTPLGPSEQALTAMKGGGGVSVTETGHSIEFAPEGAAKSALLFYPGGHVDARSYAPLATRIARDGYLVVIAKMPLSLAVLKPGAARRIIDEHPEVATWAMSGHSLGGVMASAFTAKDDRVGGLVLMASYPTEDLSGLGIACVSLAGTRDTVLDQAAWRDSESLLPPDSLKQVEGANHAQFGSYGDQPGDSAATISPEAQWTITAQAADEVLQKAATVKR